MIKVILFAIYDSKSEAFDNPFTMRTFGEAERGFRDAVNGDKSLLAKYPEDYTLFALGEVDLSTGTITSYEVKRSIATGITLKRSSNVQPLNA